MLAGYTVYIKSLMMYFRHVSAFVLLTFVLLKSAVAVPTFSQIGNTLVMSNANVVLEYNLTAGTTDFYWQKAKKIAAFYSGVTLSTGYIKGTGYSSWSWTASSSNQAVVTASGTGLPTMKQYFTLDQNDSFLVRVDVSGSNLKANWMGPVVADTTGGVNIGIANDNRALVVPFDNDGFVSYNAESMNSTGTGYEVGAFYDNTSRNGLVVGSVTHDVWKTGVFFVGANNKLNALNVYGGATAPNDVAPHGSVSGNTISSPTIFVGFGADWRVTMQNYAAENTNVVARLPWTNGVPFGWNSWGVIQQYISYADAVAVSDYFYTQLMGNHFADNGTVYINLDSFWNNNFTTAQLQSFVVHCHAHGQKAGIYWGPFVFFGSLTLATNTLLLGSTNYTYNDALLRDTNGNPELVDGGYALDPSHPAVLQGIVYNLNLFTNWGFDYVKLDFLSHGALEGVHYDPNITTGIEAYNEGMSNVLHTINGRMFISESIAPLFPYQYAHSRRIACDSQPSLISNTEYTMNSVSYGWWLDNLYQFNDPDLMVFNGYGATTNENQSRLINGAVTGVFLDGDDLTSSNGQQAAQMCLTNAAIDNVARVGQTFTPIEGNTGTAAVNDFVRQDGAVWRIAVFNYTASAVNETISLSRAGLPAGTYIATNLWDGTTQVVGNSLNVSLNAKQSKLFSLVVVPAENVTWQTPANISGASDVSTFGSYFGTWAPYDVNANNLPVNGVTFQGNSDLPDLSVSFPNNDQNGYNFFHNPGTPNTNYNSLLQYAAYCGSVTNGTIVVTWGDTPGHTYQIEVWANDGRGLFPGRSETVIGGNNTSANLDFGDAPGQHVIGTYLADSSGSQTISLNGANSTNGDAPMINLLQIRDITAANISWLTPAYISGAADVSTLGTYFGSWAPDSSSSLSVNGVTFQNNSDLPDFSTTGFNASYTSFPNPGTANNNYNTLLESGAYEYPGPACTINWGGMKPGDTYLLEFWVNGNVKGRTETLNGGANASAVMNDDPGTYIIGTFVADSSGDQTITINGEAGDNSPQVNLLQVRDITLAPDEPVIASTGTSGGNLVFSGTGGTAEGIYYVLSSTNVTTPLANWIPIATNFYDASGNFTATNVIGSGVAAQFYLIKQP
jgi:hypothetical protein